MIRPMRAATVTLVLALVASGCEKHEFEPPDREEHIGAAAAAFRLEVFDTLTWASDSIRAFEGNVVYATYCRNCHGMVGRGETEYAAQRGLAVPSLVEPGWRWAEFPDSIRRRIYVGHIEGMPTWGVAGLTLRQIDAVTHYLLDDLRPEILGDPGA